MALKAGRVGVAPSEVDEFGQIIGEITPTNVYTKTQADAKFETQTNASTEYAKLQPKTLSLPISMLEGSQLVSKTSVEQVIQTMNGGMTNVELTNRLKTFSIPVDNVAVNSEWGSAYTGTVSCDLGINLTGKKIFAYYNNNVGAGAAIAYFGGFTDVINGIINITLFRFTSGFTTGNICIIVAD